MIAGFDPGTLDLWCAGPDNPQPTLAGEEITRTLPAEVRTVIRRLQKEVRCPEAVILLAAYCVLLDAHGAGPDLVVGSPVNVRSPQEARAIGYLVNVVPLRVFVDPAKSVRDLARDIRGVFFKALEHADVPADSLSRFLPRTGSTWRSMWFRHVFNYVPDIGLSEFMIAGHPARPLVIENGRSKFDVEFFVMSTADSIRLRAVYRSEILARPDMELMLERYESLLLSFGEDVSRKIGDIPVWSQRDRAVIDSANDTAAPVGQASVLEAFRSCVSAAPDAVAVVDVDQAVSYRHLWNAASEACQFIRAAGVSPGDVVALGMPRGADLAAAVLGTWMAGATYLPIDPDHPAQRIDYQLSDSGAKIVLAAAGALAPAAAGERVLVPPRVRDAGSSAAAAGSRFPDADLAPCAYLIYTSGSTGQPKGTLVMQQGVMNVVTHFAEELGATSADATVWMTTFAFDISALELFMPLVSGGRVVVAPDSARVDGTALRDLVERHGARIIQATPTTWRLVAEQAAPCLRGRSLLCGGEPMPVGLAKQLVAAGGSLHHVYGPTETTIWSTSGTVPAHTGLRLDIGRPVRNTQVTVMDPRGRDLPIGVRGELCIAGAGVAQGYHANAELTAERFAGHHRYGRYYRTGDLARWRADGTLDLLGRSDRQVKLRGNRIELGEVEASVLSHAQVKAVAVVLAGDSSADGELVAFVEPATDSLDVGGVWEHARAKLPRAMVPSEFVVMDRLPVNSSEKVDYPALTRLAAKRRALVRVPPAPAEAADGELTEQLIGLWRLFLESENISADTNFFLHGGHSVLAAFLVQEVERLTGVSASLAEFYEEPTPEGLSALVLARKADP
jgi:amino acid adenylation domain-containing protein